MLKTSMICATVLVLGGAHFANEAIITTGVLLGCLALIGAIIKYMD